MLSSPILGMRGKIGGIERGECRSLPNLSQICLKRQVRTGVLTMDLHAEQIQGFFDIPVDNLYARPLLQKAVEDLGLTDYVVVAPDLGSIKLARAFAKDAESEIAIVDKRRVDAEHVEAGALIGNVKGKQVLLIDDMVSTGETLKKAARVCKSAGAREVFAVATHGLMVEEVFTGSAIEKLIVTNTVPLSKNLEKSPQIHVVSVASLFSRAIGLSLG